MRSPFLSVASLAVDVFVGPVAGDDRVESFAAVVTLVAFPVPFAALCKHLFSSEYNATATWTTFARWGLDYGGVDHGCTRSSIAVLQKLDQLLPPTLSVTDIKASSCTNDKINCLKVESFLFFPFYRRSSSLLRGSMMKFKFILVQATRLWFEYWQVTKREKAIHANDQLVHTDRQLTFKILNANEKHY